LVGASHVQPCEVTRSSARAPPSWWNGALVEIEAGYEEMFRLRGSDVGSLGEEMEERVERNLGRDMKVAERSKSVADGADARKSFVRGFCGLALLRV